MAHIVASKGEDVDMGKEESAFGMGDLPAELLLEIFTYCMTQDSLSLVNLRGVSWLWRNLVDSSPKLWQIVALDDSNHLFSGKRVALWAEKCKLPSYDVELNVKDPDNVLPLLSPLLPSMARWQRLRLCNALEDEIDMEESGITVDTLTHLHLCLYDVEQHDAEDDPKLTFSPISPGEDSNFAMSLWITKLPSPKILAPLLFVHVTIAEGGENGLYTQPKFILEILSACPELESFFLSGWQHDEPIVRPLPVVYLPNLVTLHLKRTCFARAFLSSIHAPNLQNLFLSLLNVDFQLQAEEPEPGDSDDEARDFSQSPWSDRATGMGLRKLIQRSNPPIRILEMDFCDMRTKDFQHVFDRLTYLEDFHIVASDMSDKVINLLRPIEPPPNGQDKLVRLRLPRLKKLRLRNCQRLTGQVLLDAIVSRVRWTDRAYPDWTLTAVHIDGCDGFSAFDRSDLLIAIGNRLKL